MRESCDIVAPELVALLDGELSDEVRRAVAGHVAECSRCSAETAQLVRVRELMTLGLARRASADRIEQGKSGFDDLWASIGGADVTAAPAGPSGSPMGLPRSEDAARPGLRTRGDSGRRPSLSILPRRRWATAAVAAIAATAVFGILVARRFEVGSIEPGTTVRSRAARDRVAAGAAVGSGAKPPAANLAQAKPKPAAPPANVATNSPPGPRDLQVPGELRDRLEFFSSYGVVRRLGKLHELDRLAAPDAQPEAGATPRGNS